MGKFFIQFVCGEDFRFQRFAPYIFDKYEWLPTLLRKKFAKINYTAECIGTKIAATYPHQEQRGAASILTFKV